MEISRPLYLGSRRLTESGQEKLRRHVSAAKSLEELQGVREALGEGRLSESLAARLQLVEADLEKEEPTKGCTSTTTAQEWHLSETGTTKLRQAVSQATSVAELAEIEAVLKGGQASPALAARLQLAEADFCSRRSRSRSRGQRSDSDSSSSSSDSRSHHSRGHRQQKANKKRRHARLATTRAAPTTRNDPAVVNGSAERELVLPSVPAEALTWEEFERRVDWRRRELDALDKMLAEDREVQPSRIELQCVMFRALDADSNGRLGRSELLSFARLAGFEGSISEWSSQYGLLCKDRSTEPSDGLNVRAFVDMTDDAEVSGCYCATNDLFAIARKLVKGLAPTGKAYTVSPASLPGSKGGTSNSDCKKLKVASKLEVDRRRLSIKSANGGG
jgi:hypothetical protein